MTKKVTIKHILFLLIILLAIFMDLQWINRPLWKDELITMGTLSNNFFKNPFYFNYTSNLPLFFYLFKVWTLIVGIKYIYLLRLLPMIFSILTLSIWMYFLNKEFSFLFSFIFGLLFATAPLQVYYSTELRPYLLTEFLLSLQTIFFYYFIIKKNKKFWLSFSLCTFLSLLSHYSAYFYILSQAIISIYIVVASKKFNKLLLTYIFFGIIALVIYFIVRSNPFFEDSINNLQQTSNNISTLAFSDIIRIKEVLTMYYWFGMYYFFVDLSLQFVFKKFIFVILLFLIYLFIKERKNKDFTFHKILFVNLSLSLLITILLENFGKYPFGGRHIMAYSIIYYFLISYVFVWFISRVKWMIVIPLFIVLLFFIFNLNSNQTCAYKLNRLNLDINIYKNCAFKDY